MNFYQETLPNGLVILAECNDHALSTGVGFYVKTGGRDESPDVAGVSHFLEHMAFKGNEHATGDDINRRFDAMGAKYNAYTTEEHTVYHAVVLPEFVEQTTDLLADLLRPALRATDFATEQKVIIEEIGMYADLPSFTAYEYAMARHFNGHPLGNSVLGTVETVGALTPEAMRRYHEVNYGPESVVVAAAGRVDWPRFVRASKKSAAIGNGQTVNPAVGRFTRQVRIKSCLSKDTTKSACSRCHLDLGQGTRCELRRNFWRW